MDEETRDELESFRKLRLKNNAWVARGLKACGLPSLEREELAFHLRDVDSMLEYDAYMVKELEDK